MNLAPTTEHPVLWLKAGRMLDSERRRILSPAHLVYDRTRILYAGEAPPEPSLWKIAPPAVPDVELPGATLLPGLIDAHTHIFLDGHELDAEKRKAYQNQPAENLLRQAHARADALLRLGIVAVRDGGDKDGVGLALSRAAAQTPAGEFPAFTRVYSPGPGIHRKGRYGSFFSQPVEEYADGAACVAARLRDGADHIKVVPTGIINFAKGAVTAAPQFSTEDVRALVQASHARKRLVMAHASGDAGIECALEGGVDTIEHAYFVRDDQLARMRDRRTAWVPTFTPVREQLDHADQMGWSAEIVDHLKRILDGHAASLARALAMGVPVLVGSDAGSCGVAHGEGLVYEMELMQAAGMSPLDVLCQATEGNRLALGLDVSLGALSAGRRAAFICTEADPFTSVSALRCPYSVMANGGLFARPDFYDPALREGVFTPA